MQTNYTLWQRIITATPPFFKRLQALGMGLAGLGTSLTQVAGVPVKVTTALISIGTTITIISQFAVKQTEPINPSTYDDIK
ncbi:hypothetical protein [Mucilaginibacter sp.]|uniref:hypothetical protein n=1 Tax=Mucilaginibacter sp. TaxID=1882438 RepID=UPI002622227E|nr:hypothetical protein [Mucilaginibacter sp.]MDB4926768.1 hypothetical protein [Mucilaginibacter sp.]